MGATGMPDKLKKQEGQTSSWESDSRIVPQQHTNQVCETKLGNASEGKAAKLTRCSDRTSPAPRGGEAVYQRLASITKKAESDRSLRFNNLYTLLTEELLQDAFYRLKRDKAPGVDGVTVDQYGEQLEENIRSLTTRLHQRSYRPQPSLRRDIPKGNGKTRPLGLATVEDKIVQRAVVTILERIYEVDFHDCSYGFRPGRSCHQALSALGQIISTRRVNWISDADVRAFFDTVNHQQLLELLGRRISDPRLLWLINRFLRAGILIEGQHADTIAGVAQGSVLSPLLANVYLHYVLDDWFQTEVKPRLAGEAHLIRYADDFICTFEHARDAERFQAVLKQRLARYSLELAEDKTKLLRFGRFAARDNRRAGLGAPETFDFLGFTHYCGRSRLGKFKLKRKTSRKKFQAKVRDLKDWFRSNLTQPTKQVWTTLNAKLLGHYQYYNVNDNWQMCLKYREAARRLGLRWLRRRGDSNEISWQAYATYLRKHPLAIPGKIVDLIKLARVRELLG
jgi:group II intron reverse transcriptase/maturase